MTEKNHSIDLRTHNGLWARLASWFVGGRLVTPEQGSQTGPVSASGTLGDSSVTDERILQISTVWRCVSLIATLTACLPLDVFETGCITDILHFYGRGRNGNETRSGECRYYPYPGEIMSTEFYGVDVVGSHYEHRLLINRGGGNMKWFIFKDDGSAYAAQGHWKNDSDRRIKSDIEKIEHGLEKVETLTGYTYVLAENRQAGVMADELERVLPEAVSNSGDYHENDGTAIKNVKAIAYGSISALLIEAIKDLSAKVKAQQAEIDALKASMPVARDADSAE